MRVRVTCEVWTWDNEPDLLEVKSLQPHRSHLCVIALKLKLIEALPLLIYLYPCVKFNVREYLILSLESKLLTKLAR